jgi:hypothetical protein
MNVVLRIERDVVVDDDVHFGNVQAAARDVSGDEDVARLEVSTETLYKSINKIKERNEEYLRFKPIQCAKSFVLIHFTVQRNRVHSEISQHHSHSFANQTLDSENDYILAGKFIQQVHY